MEDNSPPDMPGFEWARRSDLVLDLVGQPTGNEQGYEAQYEQDEQGHRLTNMAGDWVELPLTVPEPEPPEETLPEPSPPPSPPMWFLSEPRSWHLAPLPGDFVFNIAWCYFIDKRSDGLVYCHLIYPIIEEALPQHKDIAPVGDRLMVFANEVADRLWAHVLDVIAMQFD